MINSDFMDSFSVDVTALGDKATGNKVVWL